MDFDLPEYYRTPAITMVSIKLLSRNRGLSSWLNLCILSTTHVQQPRQSEKANRCFRDWKKRRKRVGDRMDGAAFPYCPRGWVSY